MRAIKFTAVLLLTIVIALGMAYCEVWMIPIRGSMLALIVAISVQPVVVAGVLFSLRVAGSNPTSATKQEG